jgi:membrane-bound ClpP family serine protease
VSFHDGSPLPTERLLGSKMEIRSEVVTRTGGRRNLDYQELKMSGEKLGVWEMKVDLRTQLGKSVTKNSVTLLLVMVCKGKVILFLFYQNF